MGRVGSPTQSNDRVVFKQDQYIVNSPLLPGLDQAVL